MRIWCTTLCQSRSPSGVFVPERVGFQINPNLALRALAFSPPQTVPQVLVRRSSNSIRASFVWKACANLLESVPEVAPPEVASGSRAIGANSLRGTTVRARRSAFVGIIPRRSLLAGGGVSVVRLLGCTNTLHLSSIQVP